MRAVQTFPRVVAHQEGRLALQAVTDAHGVDAHGVGANSAQPHGLG